MGSGFSLLGFDFLGFYVVVSTKQSTRDKVLRSITWTLVFSFLLNNRQGTASEIDKVRQASRMESTPFAMRMCQKLMNYLQYSAIFLKASAFFFGIDNYHQLNWMSRRGLEVTFKD